MHGIIGNMVLSSVKEDRNFKFLLWFIPIYSGIVTNTIFLTLGIHSLNLHMNLIVEKFLIYFGHVFLGVFSENMARA